MAKLKKGAWEPDEVKQLKKIPKGKNAKQALEALAKKLKRPYNTTYQRWWSLGSEEEGEEDKGKDKNLAKKKVTPMELEADPNFNVVGKFTLSPDEIKAFELGLKDKLDLVQPGKGAIIIPRRFEKTTRAYLDKHYPERKYTQGIIKDNKGFKRLMRSY